MEARLFSVNTMSVNNNFNSAFHHYMYSTAIK